MAALTGVVGRVGLALTLILGSVAPQPASASAEPLATQDRHDHVPPTVPFGPACVSIGRASTPAPAPTPLVALRPEPSLTLTSVPAAPAATIPPKPSPPPPIMPTPVQASVFRRVINVGYAAIRATPSTTARTIAKIPHGQLAGILAKTQTSTGDWYKIAYRDNVGYVRAIRLEPATVVGRNLATRYPRVIVVARRQQHVEVWDHGRLMLISAVTTGRPELRTPLGTMKILRKQSPHLFRSPWPQDSPYYYEPGWAEYALLFRNVGFWFHDTHYRPENGFGIGTNVPHVDPDGVERTGSRGCVNTPYWAVRRLYGWAVLNDPVVVVDA